MRKISGREEWIVEEERNEVKGGGELGSGRSWLGCFFFAVHRSNKQTSTTSSPSQSPIWPTHTRSCMLRSTYLHPLTHAHWGAGWPPSPSDVDYAHTPLESSVFLIFKHITKDFIFSFFILREINRPSQRLKCSRWLIPLSSHICRD